MILLFILVFRFLQLTSVIEMVLREPHGRKYLSLKTAKARIFSTVNHKEKFLPAAGRIPKFGPSRKRQTLYMIR